MHSHRQVVGINPSQMTHLEKQKELLRLANQSLDTIEKTQRFYEPIDPIYCRTEVAKLVVTYSEIMAMLLENLLNVPHESGSIYTSAT